MKKPLAEIIQDANSTLIAEGDLQAVSKFFTEDYVVHLTNRDMSTGHDGICSLLGKLLESFPDVAVEVKILIEGENRISWQRTLRGTHSRAYRGFPASNLQIVWRDMVTSEIKDGLIAEEWLLTDLAEQLLLSRKRKA